MIAAPNPTQLPDGLACYRRTGLFTEATVPTTLLGDHRTKPGCWGLIRVISGKLRYLITDHRRLVREQILVAGSQPGIVEPDILHCVAPEGEVEFFVEFWRSASS